MVLDEPKETDFQLERDEVLYLVDRMVLARCGTITVDFEEEEDWSGFALVSENPLLGGC